jgi:hypothetical protein
LGRVRSRLAVRTAVVQRSLAEGPHAAHLHADRETLPTDNEAALDALDEVLEARWRELSRTRALSYAFPPPREMSRAAAQAVLKTLKGA